MDTFSLINKIAVVTGVNGKLGKVWVRALADCGASVVATDIQETAGEWYNAEMCNNDGNDSVVEYFGGVDITKRSDVVRLNEFCKKRFGVADILVNNAGIDQPPAKDAAPYTIEDYPEDVFCDILRVNTYGAFNMIQVFGNEMKRAAGGGFGGKGGSIINIGSLYASVSPDEKFYDHMDAFIKPPSYGMSKAAVVNMTKYLAAHWGRYNIRVNTLSPGGVEGGQDAEFKSKFIERVPLGRMAEFDDLTGPLVFLASDASKYVTGIELKADGGFTAL